MRALCKFNTNIKITIIITETLLTAHKINMLKQSFVFNVNTNIQVIFTWRYSFPDLCIPDI